jgi:tRNA(Ile2) C34 agmatinyltransferase TiaS
MSTLFIGLDDTDIRTSPGTGHLARHIASILAARLPLIGVTRHQLLFDPRVPMTAKNSANVIHLQVNATTPQPNLPQLAAEVANLVQARFQPGSDPGLCVAIDPPRAIAEFGWRTQATLIKVAEARTLADEYNLILRPLGGDGGGIIGALAAVGLASTGNDGRFNWIGQIRELRGVQPVAAVLAAGIVCVQTTTGKIIHRGQIDTGDKARPSLLGGQAVLWVEPAGDLWQAVRRD